ncbi:MAG: DUF2085 domain-containing protein [Chloracidobacterium sp.]|nr:DUF2085 domain-containing protein [Chloracidobacterium sp.]
MPEPASNYVSLDIAKLMRKQAFRVWTIGLVVVFAWVLLIGGLPVAKANGFVTISSPLYYFFSFICHQIPKRSLHIAGEQFAVCSRCFGVYFGLLFGFAVYPLWRNIDDIEPLAKFWLFVSLIPMTLDWALTFFGIWENTQFSRFLTGMIVGAACSTFIVPATVEITRNFTSRNHLR